MSNPSLTSSELGRLSDALELLRGIDPDLTILQAHILVLIADQPGMSVGELAEALETSSATVSRIASILGKFGSRGREGLMLVAIEEKPEDRRVKLLSLTPKGERVVEKLRSILS